MLWISSPKDSRLAGQTESQSEVASVFCAPRARVCVWSMWVCVRETERNGVEVEGGKEDKERVHRKGMGCIDGSSPISSLVLFFPSAAQGVGAVHSTQLSEWQPWWRATAEHQFNAKDDGGSSARTASPLAPTQ